MRGSGVAWLGDGGPRVVAGNEVMHFHLAPGWYRIEPGSSLQWELDADTRPDSVASLEVLHAQVIEANQEKTPRADGTRRGVNEAIGVSPFAKSDPYAPTGTSWITSVARPTSSRWFAWAPRSLAVAGVLRR